MVRGLIESIKPNVYNSWYFIFKLFTRISTYNLWCLVFFLVILKFYMCFTFKNVTFYAVKMIFLIKKLDKIVP